MTEFVTVACKLPSGLMIEVGFEYPKDDRGGVMGANVTRSEGYRRFALNGSNSTLVMAGQPAELNPAPGITQVPKDIWDAWVAPPAKGSRGGMGFRHPAVKNGLIVVVPAETDADTVRMSLETRRSGLEPLDPNKLPADIEEAPVDGRVRLSKPKAA